MRLVGTGFEENSPGPQEISEDAVDMFALLDQQSGAPESACSALKVFWGGPLR